jgi:hypothetical protein
VFPLGFPALAPELTWLAGFRYPQSIDWGESHAIATQLIATKQGQRLIADYQPALCPALAVFAKIACQKGHWIEVQPGYDPADDIPVDKKTYILPIARSDEVLIDASRRGWQTIYGGTTRAAIVAITPNLVASDVVPIVMELIHSEAWWLSQNTTSNTISAGEVVDWWRSHNVESFQERLSAQREHAGRLELACLLLADATYATDRAKSRALRDAARGFGVIASFLSDGLAVDYLDDYRINRFKHRTAILARVTESNNSYSVLPDPVVTQLSSVVHGALGMAGATFRERPSGDLTPWLKS